MTKIAIFCDGTWNDPDMDHDTNVFRLYEAVRDSSKAADQKVLYKKGVGTGRGKNFFARKVDWLGGGAFGWGLNRNIAEIYHALAKTYEPGDKIYIFGFSRGAYTARSLAGLIRACGIPTRNNLHQIDKAMDRYRDRDPSTHPDTDASAAWRWNFASHVVTGQAEADWRKRNRYDAGTKVDIEYLGLWDTVGALGVPGFLGLFAKVTNGHYKFHDTNLSSSVRSARHAVSIDEKRAFYPPTYLNNVADLNRKTDHEDLYLEQWFPGDHGILGGSGKERGLSNYAMMWVAEGAQRMGLKINAKPLKPYTNFDAGSPLTNLKFGLSGIVPMYRTGPKDTVSLNQAVTDRVKITRKGKGDIYMPKPLFHLRHKIATLLGFAWDDGDRASPDFDDDEEDDQNRFA